MLQKAWRYWGVCLNVRIDKLTSADVAREACASAATVSCFTRLFIGLALASALTASGRAATICNVREFGAKGDGVTKDTAAIQAAIDSCAKKGGGTIRIAGGTFVSAPIVLRDHTTLELVSGAVLLGSPDHADYPAKTEFRNPGLQALVSATGAFDLAIVGGGTIDGNGASWWAETKQFKDSGILGSVHTRPRLVVFDHCRHIRIEGVTIQNSPMWQLVPFASDDIVIRNVRVLAPEHSPNTDGIDPFSSSNVLIDHVFVDVGDDNVAIKSGAINSPGGDLPSKNIRITNVDFRHGHGLSIGSEIAGGAQNIVVEHAQFHGTDNGLRIKANRDRGNDVSDIHFSDIQMTDVKIALIVSEYYPALLPAEGVAPAPLTRLTPHFHDITFTNITATATRSAGAIVGLPEAPVTGLTLRNVSIQSPEGMTIGYANILAEHLEIHATSGPALIKLPGAVLTTK
jgi:polygalacturonase